MVTGLDLFRERFAAFSDSYVLIGGAACYIHEEMSAQVPRATKDLDVVLHIPDDAHLEPIPAGDELSSLSAILMNESYYRYTIAHSRLVEGVHIANIEALICLKAKAYVDLCARKAQGEHVDQDDIEKHKKDGRTLVHHARWQTVPDYAVIQACGRTVMSVGGAVSVDRQIRLHEMERHPGKQYYWPNEAARYDAEALDAVRDAGLKVDIVVTHTAPSMCEFQSKQGLATWAQEDPSLLNDCEAERAVMDKILVHLKRDGHPLERWYYGHFHNSWHSEIEGVWFKMLDIMELLEVPRLTNK